jgi:hypothetical protein
MGKALVVGEVGRSGVGAYCQAVVVHHQGGHGHALWKHTQARCQQLLDAGLDANVQRGVDARGLGV